HSGKYAAQFAGDHDQAIISQDIATTTGHLYDISFWLRSDGFQLNNFAVSFGGQLLYSATNLPAFAYTNFDFKVPATAGTSTLEFRARYAPAYSSPQDSSVGPPPPLPAPDPASLTLLGIGAAGVAGAWVRKRRALPKMA